MTIKGNTAHVGSLVYQVVQLLNSLSAVGQSRHEAKRRARAVGFDKPVGVHGLGTVEKYIKRNVHFAKWCRANYGAKTLDGITQEMVDGYFATLADGSASTWDTDISALNKLRVAMELHGIDCRFAPPPGRPRRLAERLHQQSYSAQQIARLLAVLPEPYRLMAELQWETGARWVSLKRLRAGDIQNNVWISGKGGQGQWRPVTRRLRSELLRWIGNAPAEDRVFHRSYGAYRAALVRACHTAGVPYDGTHALRRSFARSRLGELMRLGQPEGKAREIIAKEMGHGDNRGRITWAYAGKEVVAGL